MTASRRNPWVRACFDLVGRFRLDVRLNLIPCSHDRHYVFGLALSRTAMTRLTPEARRGCASRWPLPTMRLRSPWKARRMDTRRLYSFIKIIDAGSITRAADIL